MKYLLVNGGAMKSIVYVSVYIFPTIFACSVSEQNHKRSLKKITNDVYLGHFTLVVAGATVVGAITFVDIAMSL